MREVKCGICGAVFMAKTNGKYCSDKCKERAHINCVKARYERVKQQRKEAPKPKRYCEWCGSEIIGNRYRFCSAKCNSNFSKSLPMSEEHWNSNDRCICRRLMTCKYAASLDGSNLRCCDYIGKTGKSRGGYPDECTHYEPKKKRGRK